MCAASADPERSEAGAYIAAVGRRVRRARESLGLSRRQLAERAGVSQRHLAQLELGGGNVSIGLLWQLARALGSDPAELAAEVSSELPALILRYRAADSGARRRAMDALPEMGRSADRGARIALIGLRGAGKSTLGRQLAEHLDLPFDELSECVERRAGLPLGELMGMVGLQGYRQLERDALQSLLGEQARGVLAVGGGVVEDDANFALLRQHWHTLWLRARPEEHMDRVRAQGDQRPMAGHPAAMDALRQLLLDREPLYRQADACVDTRDCPPTESFKRLLAAARCALQSHP